MQIVNIITGHKILFRGLDDGLKITSISVAYGVLCFVWIEEAFEITNEDDFNKLDMSIDVDEVKTIPGIKSAFNLDFGGQRAARGEDGKTYYVSNNMKYEEWKKKYIKDLKGDKKDDKVEPIMKDITKEWTNNIGSTVSKVEDLKEFTINNVNYKVSGADVRFEYDGEEKAIATLLSKASGKKIYMLPKINKPDGISTADYLIDGEFYDLKRIYGSGKRTLKDAVKDKKKQSKRFILKITEKSKLSSDEITRQSEGIFHFSETNFVDEIVIIKDDKLMKVLKRG